ncbi:MAG: DUF6273 domain-containing protein [Clostridia bacterium]
MKKSRLITSVLLVIILSLTVFVSACGVDGEDIVTKGEYMEFGLYPQAIKADNVTVEQTAGEDGYFLGSDGFKYAKRTAKLYDKDKQYKFSDGTIIVEGQDYYFKVEPINWRILSKGSSIMLLTDKVIDCVSYSDDQKTGQNPNNYEKSSLRHWLNNSFYGQAFDSSQQDKLRLTELDNKKTAYRGENNKYAICQANTFDAVFLLSLVDVLQTKYGFSTAMQVGKVRAKVSSDFARCNGLWISTVQDTYGTCWWWLRSADPDSDKRVSHVGNMGAISNYCDVIETSVGVAPAIVISNY